MTAVDYAASQAPGPGPSGGRCSMVGRGLRLLLTPTLAEPPPLLTEFENNPEDPTAPTRRAGGSFAFTPAFNISGQPAISLPLHLDTDGLPIGIHSSPPTAGRTSSYAWPPNWNGYPWSFDHPAIP